LLEEGLEGDVVMKRNVVKVVDKPWGRELWLAVEGEYAGKILEVRKGCRLSLQYHERKKESMFLLEGQAKLTVDGKEVMLAVGDSVTIEPEEVHRLEALSDVKVIEISTPQVEDVVRLEDDYGR
jgi:mannose-6-phosphate isomerase-like protein (cupin superfamily)